MKHGIYQVASNKYEVWKNGELIAAPEFYTLAKMIVAKEGLPLTIKTE